MWYLHVSPWGFSDSTIWRATISEWYETRAAFWGATISVLHFPSTTISVIHFLCATTSVLRFRCYILDCYKISASFWAATISMLHFRFCYVLECNKVSVTVSKCYIFGTTFFMLHLEGYALECYKISATFSECYLNEATVSDCGKFSVPQFHYHVVVVLHCNLLQMKDFRFLRKYTSFTLRILSRHQFNSHVRRLYYPTRV